MQAHAIAAYRSGLTLWEVADQLIVSHSTVERWLKRVGEPIRRPGRAPRTDTRPDATHMLRQPIVRRAHAFETALDPAAPLSAAGQERSREAAAGNLSGGATRTPPEAGAEAGDVRSSPNLDPAGSRADSDSAGRSGLFAGAGA